VVVDVRDTEDLLAKNKINIRVVNGKLNSSSTSFKSQNLHIIFSFLIVVYLPLLISKK
jgi:hypothetical protein